MALQGVRRSLAAHGNLEMQLQRSLGRIRCNKAAKHLMPIADSLRPANCALEAAMRGELTREQLEVVRRLVEAADVD